jgi:hypothetical protein
VVGPVGEELTHANTEVVERVGERLEFGVG